MFLVFWFWSLFSKRDWKNNFIQVKAGLCTCNSFYCVQKAAYYIWFGSWWGGSEYAKPGCFAGSSGHLWVSSVWSCSSWSASSFPPCSAIARGYSVNVLVLATSYSKTTFKGSCCFLNYQHESIRIWEVHEFEEWMSILPLMCLDKSSVVTRSWS